MSSGKRGDPPTARSRADSSERQRIQSMDRAVALLGAVSTMAPADATLAALAQRCDLNRSTAWRLLATLRHHHFVEYDQLNKTYRIGVPAYDLGGVDADLLLRRVRPTLIDLPAPDDVTVGFAAPHGLALIYLDVVTPPNVPAVTSRWYRVALHASSMGKAYLAALPWSEVALVLPEVLERHTTRTLVTKQALRSELARTREQGFAIGRGEYTAWQWGASAAVVNAAERPVAVISMWRWGAPLDDNRLALLGGLVTKAAQDVACILELH